MGAQMIYRKTKNQGSLLTLATGGAHIGFNMNSLYRLLILLFSIIAFITIYFEFFNKKY